MNTLLIIWLHISRFLLDLVISANITFILSSSEKADKKYRPFYCYYYRHHHHHSHQSCSQRFFVTRFSLQGTGHSRRVWAPGPGRPGPSAQASPAKGTGGSEDENREGRREPWPRNEFVLLDKLRTRNLIRNEVWFTPHALIFFNFEKKDVRKATLRTVSLLF